MKDTVIIPWNNIFLECVRKLGGAPGPIARIGAMMHIAMFDTINVLSGSPYKSYVSNLPKKVEGVDPAMSAAYAARKLLRQTIAGLVDQATHNPGGVSSPFEPYQLNMDFNAEQFLQDSMKPFNMGSSEEARNSSRKFGEAVADAVLAARQNDGADPTTQKQPPAVEFGFAPGDWRETGSGSAVTPQWGKVKPFGGWQSAQIGNFLPKALNVSEFSNYSQLLPSRDYAGQVNEVQRLGEAHSPERTREQTEIAFFWANDLNGTSKPPGQLYTITQIVAKQEGTVQNLLDTARLFALVGMRDRRCCHCCLVREVLIP